jgi:hypothetical protein
MLPSIKSESTNPEKLLEDLQDRLLEALDRARNLDDLIQSLQCQRAIITAILSLCDK